MRASRDDCWCDRSPRLSPSALADAAISQSFPPLDAFAYDSKVVCPAAENISIMPGKQNMSCSRLSELPGPITSGTRFVVF
jgi:hypothetical protein